MQLITERYCEKIHGVISCFDRLILHGTLNPVGHSDGMTSYLYSKHIRIFDFPQFAKSITEKIRDHIAAVAKVNSIEIEHIRKSSDRKEDKVAKILKHRGGHSGIVCILSAMEACSSFEPWHDKKSGRTGVLSI